MHIIGHKKMTAMQHAKIFLYRSLHIDEGQICLFTVYPVLWLYHVEGTFFRKKNNADTLPVLKKIYHEH